MKAERRAVRARHIERKTVGHALVGEHDAVLAFQQFAMADADRFVLVVFAQRDGVIAQRVEQLLGAQ